MTRSSTEDRREFGRRVAALAALAGLAGADVPKAKPIGLGPAVSLGGRRPFPDDDHWNRDVSRDPVDPNSETLLQGIGLDKGLHADFGTFYQGVPNGIPYVVVPGNQPRLPMRFHYDQESNPGPYPIPANPPIEGGPEATGDRHVLVLDRDRWRLYELFDAHRDGRGWRAGSGAVWDLAARSATQRPAGWGSADAAGLPIFPGLVRYDEVHEQKAIRHALRFTCVRTRHAYIAPARHYASRLTDPNLPPMGMRVRLKAGYDVSRFPASVQVILNALKRHGMLLADNGGNWFISGAPDPRWSDDDLGTIRRVQGRDLEVVRMGAITTR